MTRVGKIVIAPSLLVQNVTDADARDIIDRKRRQVLENLVGLNDDTPSRTADAIGFTTEEETDNE